ncbi:MAG: glutamine amidotransferase [Planctomycetales bacterium]|jgi:uncharacterized membrane protein
MISIGSPIWLIPATIVAVVGALLVRNAAGKGHAPERIRRLAGVLKVFALVLLAICLIEPVWSGVHPRPHSNLFLVLTDTSQSHIRTASDDDDSKLETQFKAALQPTPESWLDRLGQDFEVHQFSFDRRVKTVQEFDELAWTGEASALKSALLSLGHRFEERHVGGIVLLSDGNATDLTAGDLSEGLGSDVNLPPVYPVLFDQKSSLPDVAIASVSISETPFEDAPVSLQCNVRVHDLKMQRVSTSDLLVECCLIDADGETIKTERQAIADPDATLPFRFQFRPIKTGVAFYRLQVNALDLSGETDSPLEEGTLENNSRIVQVNRGSAKHRILYVCGRPNWEFKFLRRSVEEDDQIDLLGMIRVAKREAKFDFRGRDGQSSNSLFRGFKGETDEETEKYDEPVIVRLNTKFEDELRAGFPKDAKDLFGFDALILDDVEAEFFNRDQLTLIEKFVSERGGGLLMLGGAECFHTGGYERTPVADALPVYLDRTQFPEAAARLTLDLTREGWLQPWVRLRPTEIDEHDRLKTMPAFRTLNPTQGIKPGASVMSTVSDASGEHWPAMVTQSYGRGRSGAMLVGDLWRWQIGRNDEQPEDLPKAWRQTLRWLIADVQQRVDVEMAAADDVAPEAVRVNVRVVDEEFLPLDNAQVQIRVSGPAMLTKEDAAQKDDSSTPEPEQDPSEAGTSASEEAVSDEAVSDEVVLNAEASLDEPGVYTAVFVPKEAGAWTVEANATTGEGEKLTADKAGWIYEPAVQEFQRSGVNLELLSKLAEQTKGEIVQADELDDFVSKLQSKPMPVVEAWTMPLWDQPLVFLIVLCCLVGEWGLRRSTGLP